MYTRTWLALAAALCAATAWAERPAPPTDEELTAVFVAADADGSGGLDRAEFDAYVQGMRQLFGDQRFAKADADGNGELTQDELAAARPPHGGCRGRRGPGMPPPM